MNYEENDKDMACIRCGESATCSDCHDKGLGHTFCIDCPLCGEERTCPECNGCAACEP